MRVKFSIIKKINGYIMKTNVLKKMLLMLLCVVSAFGKELVSNVLPIADPYILFYNDTYYAYGTSRADGFDVYSSKDLKSWERSPSPALSKEDSYGDKWFWAPEVYYVAKDKKFYMYYSVEEHVCVATSDSPLGHANKDNWFTAVGWEINKSIEGKTYWTNKLSDEGKTYAADFATELQTVLTMINKQNSPITKIVLNRDIVLSDLYAAQSNIGKYSGIMNFQKTITLDGQGHKISGTFLPADSNNSYYVIKLDANSAGSTIQNLTIEGTNATALDLITGIASSGKDTTVYVKNVNLYDNTGGGLNVNATTVVAEDLHTRGNGHGVRVTVDGSRGKGAANPHLTLKGNSRLEESVKIAYNAKENMDTYKQPALARSIKDRLSFVTIETPDKDNWKTTWQMANLSKSFKADNAVLTWTNDLDETALAGKKLAKMTHAAELDSLFTFGGSTVDGIVWTAAEKQTLTKDIITLDRSFAIVGNDTSRCIVKGKWVIAPSDTVDVTLSSLKLTESNTAADTTAIINIDKPKVNLTLDNVKVDMQTVGGDRSGTLYKKEHAAIEIVSTVTSSTVKLNNSKIQLGANEQAGFYNKGGSCNFTMDKSEISVIEGKALSGMKAILAIGAAGSTYDINNSTLSVSDNNHYAVWIKSAEQHFAIDNSEVYGWAAFYMQGAYIENGADGMTLKATHSSFTGVGKEGSSNGFGVIVFEGTEHSAVEMDDCVITSKIIDNTKNYGFIPPIVFQMGGGTGVSINRPSRKPSADCSVSLKNCTLQNMAEATTPIFVSYENVLETDADGYIDYNRNKVSIDSNTKFLNADGSKSILIQNGDTLRSASKTLPNALVYLNGSAKKVVAYPGDIITTELTAAKALTSLNAEDAMPTGYNVPDSITIVCKDAYLVTGEKAAKAFAENVSDKVVFYLKQSSDATPVFSTVAAGNNRIKVTENTTWNDAGNANRSVEIAAGATLTINVAMALDSVFFMSDDAQLVSDVEVTAKAIRLIYPVEKFWKAFSFPVGGMTVTDVKGTAVSPVSDEDADKGVWFGGLAAETAPTFDLKSAFATSGIIASDHDSTLWITSNASAPVSLKSKAEPTAPVTKAAVGKTFQLVANPNVCEMALNQIAYVLDDKGETFVRTTNPTIKAFQSFILADAATTSTLRSLKVGDTPTGNEIIPVEGYYVHAGKGTIMIHTSEPVQVVVVDMLGRVYYNARVSDGYQITVPAGIYAVNRQKVIVK